MIQPLAVAATLPGLTQALGADMKLIVGALISTALLCSCATGGSMPTSNEPATAKIQKPLASPTLLQELKSLLSKNPDLKQAYLVVVPPDSTYMLVPVFDGAPNMISLYEAVDLFKLQEPPLELGLALLTPPERKRLLSGSEPFYVRR